MKSCIIESKAQALQPASQSTSTVGPAKQACDESLAYLAATPPAKRQPNRLVRLAKSVVMLGLAIPTYMAGHKTYRMWPMSKQPTWDGLTQAQAVLPAYSSAIGVPVAQLYVHHSRPGTLQAESEPHYWFSSLIAVHTDVERLFTAAQFKCLIAHEVAHACEGAQSPCKTPDSFSPWRLGNPIHDREHKADYLGSLLCGKEEMIDMLQALGTGVGMDAESLTHPTALSRMAYVEASNATFNPSQTRVYNRNDNPFYVGAKQSGSMYLFAGISYGVYRFVSRRGTATA